MSVSGILRDLGGCAGGRLIYRVADKSMELRHPRRQRRKLQLATIRRLQPFYPIVDLRAVDFVTSADLSLQQLFEEDAQAITFGSRMWFVHKRRRIEESDAGLLLLMHELVHVSQYRALGSSKSAFACAYGAGYLEAGTYADNPLEKEAYEFVRAIGLPPPVPAPQPEPMPGSWLQPTIHMMLTRTS